MIALRNKWQQATIRGTFSSTAIKEHSVVCSLHFHACDFKQDFTRRSLKPGAVPSVFSGLTASLARKIDSTTAATVSTSTPLPTVNGRQFLWPTQLAKATTKNVPTRAPVVIGGLVAPVLQPSMTQGTTKKRKRTPSSASLSQEHQNYSERPAVPPDSDHSSEGRDLKRMSSNLIK
ncbi:hypothetical protein HPB51_012107 [Rhipicephalus microplus]|uniref:THAP-type domain-containing protein n=1 Tax=Rhipicephalus microplus TaxID=6941 RepID=A0A9J6DND7_RHIMP|nr:hypothetical protein HPB51_012107 [Rhipicephalus microplus]